MIFFNDAATQRGS